MGILLLLLVALGGALVVERQAQAQRDPMLCQDALERRTRQAQWTYRDDNLRVRDEQAIQQEVTRYCGT